MAFRKVNVELDNLTPERAQQHAALPPLPGEREVKLGREKWLADKLREGNFVGTMWAVAINKETGITYRADGQHSSTLLTRLPDDLTFPTGLLATVETYEMDSVNEDGEALFDLFNNPASVRSNKDKMGIFRARFEAIGALDRGLLVAVANAIAMYEGGIPKGLVYPPRERGNYFKQERYQRLALWIHDFNGSINDDLLSKVGVVAEMAADFVTNPELADEFWNHVLSEDHTDPNHDTRVLARTLKEMAARKKFTAENYRKRAQLVWKRYLRERTQAAA